MNKMYRILGKRGRITIPFEIRKRVGFAYNDVLSFTEAADGRTVVVNGRKSAATAKRRDTKSKPMRSRSLIFSTVSPKPNSMPH